MIYGIGTDIVQVARIEAALARSGERFAAKILGPEELVLFHERRAKHAREAKIGTASGSKCVRTGVFQDPRARCRSLSRFRFCSRPIPYQR